MKLDKYDSFILEKRIAQISSNIEVVYGFDIIKTIHADKQSDFSKRNIGHNHTISNREISDFVELFKSDISQHIANGEIVGETKFVIRSKNLSIVFNAVEVTPKYWKLVIITLWPGYDIKVGYNQLVLDK